MSMERVFMDWGRPLLPAAADYLISQSAPAGAIDLSSLIVVLPGGRAARRLLEILVQQAEQRGRALVPPTIVTAGRLPDLVCRFARPLADPLVEQMAWARALQRMEPTCLTHLVPSTPAASDWMAWLSLGEMLARLHRDLAADGLDFAAVAQAGPQLADFAETSRWQCLSQLQTEYLRLLDELGVLDSQTARLLAIKHGEVAAGARIVLVGVADMNRTLRRILDCVADQTAALVFAPEELADRFDAHGCVRPEAWQDVSVPLSDEQIETVGDPADQAHAALRAIASLDGRYSAEEITLGVPDRQVAPHLLQQLEQCQIAARDSVGRPLAEAGPCRLLRAAADYLERRRFCWLAALARHPAVQDWLDARSIGVDWLTEMDEYYAEHLPHRLTEEWSAPPRYAGLKAVVEAVDNLLRPLAAEPRTLGRWGEPIVELLVAMYGSSPLDATAEPDRTILAACDKIHEVLRRQAAIPGDLAPTVAGIEALRLLLRQVEGDTVAPAAQHGAVELLGWLELPLDDAPALVVTGFNEGVVPGSLGADLFLPNQLRRSLGVEDADRRYARDAYALAALAASRRFLHVIAGRRTAEGDPLAPSRLLFACDEATVARRVLRFFAAEQSPPASFSGTLRAGQEWSALAVPRPQPLAEPVASMRVTEFRDYLACPYRYYLRHRLQLVRPSDAATELDEGAFGSLAHEVLKRFGQNAIHASTAAEKIRAWLDDALDRLVAERFGKVSLPAVHVQIEQLRLRLGAFARWQAEWAGQGWRIQCVEQSAAEGTALMVDGSPMLLRGRIDRIDRHRSGKLVVFDYKTSDSPRSPERAHRSEGRWIDLQLPLYRHLLAGLGIEGPAQLGYIAIPKDTSRVGQMLAEWSEAQLRDADAAAADVVRKVRAETFWPPAASPPAGFAEFAAVCHDDQFSVVLAAEEGGDGA